MNKKMNFSSAYQELQQITDKFESQDLDLEASIPQFKRATELVKFLKSRLKDIENQIEEISLDEEDSNSPS
jgi:exodeoxyribonuclease VII small subunit